MEKNNFSEAQVLITGGAGFIGSNLTEKLVNMGANVTVVDMMLSPYGGNKFNLHNIREKIVFIKQDIREEKAMRKLVKGKDFIFHLAGQTGRVISMNNPFFDYDINCNGTLYLLDAIKEQKKKPKLIFSSSRGVIGNPIYFPVDENHPTKPMDIYGVHKLTAEHYCQIYSIEYNIPVTILRFNNVYGPKCQIKSDHYGTVNIFIGYALQNKPLPVYGTGTQTRDYLYVGDAVSALIKATHRKANGCIFFVGTEKEYSILDIVNVIKKKIPNVKHEMVSYPLGLKKIDFPRFVSSYKKINSMLKWEPKVSFEEGIVKTIKFYKKHIANYV